MMKYFKWKTPIGSQWTMSNFVWICSWYLSREVIVEAKFSRDGPVRVILHSVHIGVFDQTAEVVKFQLQTRGFLQHNTATVWVSGKIRENVCKRSSKGLCSGDPTLNSTEPMNVFWHLKSTKRSILLYAWYWGRADHSPYWGWSLWPRWDWEDLQGHEEQATGWVPSCLPPECACSQTSWRCPKPADSAPERKRKKKKKGGAARKIRVRGRTQWVLVQIWNAVNPGCATK